MTSMRMRTHYLLAPPSEAGGPEKLRCYVEEANGNKLLDENTTFGPVGRMHRGLRKIFGGFSVRFLKWYVAEEEENEEKL